MSRESNSHKPVKNKSFLLFRKRFLANSFFSEHYTTLSAYSTYKCFIATRSIAIYLSICWLAGFYVMPLMLFRSFVFLKSAIGAAAAAPAIAKPIVLYTIVGQSSYSTSLGLRQSVEQKSRHSTTTTTTVSQSDCPSVCMPSCWL